jgi:HD-GYP domain-containing protein (c-di-GMP phosphodiesterase class II)
MMSLVQYEQFIGKRLVHDIFDTNGTLLIGKGTVLLDSHIEKLSNFRIKTEDVTAVQVDLQSPDEKQSVDTMSYNYRLKVKQASEYLAQIDHYVHHNGVVPIDDVEEKVLPIIKEAAEQYNLYQVIFDLKEQGDYRYKQIIGVAVLATALGKRLGMDEDELALLMTAAILYDIGSVTLPSALINKPEKYDVHDFGIMKQHTFLGHKLLGDSKVDPRIARVALQHHEREDGSGYPTGKKGAEIDRFSKIVALADVYMAMISERPYRPAFTFIEVIDQIHGQILNNKFDPVIGHTFLGLLVSRQTGCEVVLSDDRRAKVVLTNVNYPTRPLLLLENNEFLDLSKSDDMNIMEVIG